MSFQTLKRAFLVAGFALIAAQTVLAGGPSARTGARAVFNEATQSGLLFGGLTSTDSATLRPYVLDETWAWDGTRWIRRYPANVPPARFSHSMVYDAAREQVLLFGGRNTDTELADTWIYKNNNWTAVESASSPSKRVLAGLAFDDNSDRVVLFGGQRVNDEGNGTTFFYDMWEFDGTQWTRLLENGPQMRTPLLVFDDARDELLLLGHDDKLATHMYVWNRQTSTWDERTPQTLPPCVNESAAAFIPSEGKVFLLGGVCVPEDTTKSSPSTEEIFKWDGTNWAKVEGTQTISRGVNVAFLHDSFRDVSIMFGGTTAYTTIPRNATYAFSFGNWSFPTDKSSPGPRSLYAMAADTANNIIYMVGGIGDTGTYTDFWKFENGLWKEIVAEDGPTCVSPTAAFDKDRGKLVVVCSDSGVFEWDGSKWTEFTNLKPTPPGRRFSSLVYDENIRKTVLFGGYDVSNIYQNKTWTWDGSKFTEVKKKRAPARSLTAMWYDPILKRTVIYGGIGRRNPDSRITRYDDMWSFDGSGWTEIKPTTKPGTRYGAQVGVDRFSGRTILFGGLRLETDDKGLQKQVYANDTWEWDGQNWSQVNTEGAPTPRENAGLEFFAPTGELVLFGGWGGYYLADTWVYDEGKWRVLAE
jgi:hypothetical protein